MTNIQTFKELHKTDEPLLLGNVWNPQSAKVYENLGYKVVATSSSAVAHSLGYEDGENMSFTEYLYIVERILKSISIPLTVDLEGGYGKMLTKSFQIFQNWLTSELSELILKIVMWLMESGKSKRKQFLLKN